MAKKKYLKQKSNLLITEVGVIILVLLCFGAFALLFLSVGLETVNGRSGEKLFKTFVLDPIPDSVIILHSQDDGIWMDYVLLHFKISPNDFILIQESKPWKISSPASFDGFFSVDHSETNWWDLSSLGKNASNYSTEYMTNNNQNFRVENIWVNSGKTEVFFEVVFVY